MARHGGAGWPRLIGRGQRPINNETLPLPPPQRFRPIHERLFSSWRNLIFNAFLPSFNAFLLKIPIGFT